MLHIIGERTALRQRLQLAFSVRNLARIIVIAYFASLGLGVFEGASVGTLFLPFLRPEIAEILGSVLVIALCLALLFNLRRRTMALCLSIAVFWASYLGLAVHEAVGQLEVFWRDLAMIAALLFIDGRMFETGETASKDNSGSGVLEPESRKKVTSAPERPVVRQRDIQSKPKASHPKRVRSELYRQDLEIVRLS